MSRRAPLLALVGVTAIWGVTFVQVQDAIALYPLFAFLAVRFAISTVVLAPFAWSSLRTLPRSGYVAGVGVGVLLATAYGLQTAGLELTTVASTGFITGLYVVFTPLLALAFFGTPVPRVLWAGVALAVVGLLLLNGVPGGSALGNALVLANAVFQAFQITAMERFAPRYDPRALTFLHDGDLVRRLHRDRARARGARGPARRDGLGRAPRDRSLRRRARLPDRDLGAGAARLLRAPRSCSRSRRRSPRSRECCSRTRCSGGSAGSAARS